MRWLTKFYDFRLKWTATAGIEIHPTKAWSSLLVNFKNAIWHFRITICYKICFKPGKIPQKHIECFKLLLEHLAWIEHESLSGIRDSRKSGSLWGMMRGVGRVKKSEQQTWLAKGFGFGLLHWGFKRFIGKRPALFKSGLRHFHQDNAPVHNSILVTDYLTKTGIKTVPYPPYSPDLAACDFCLFPELRGCRYETIEEMKEVVTKVITRSRKRTSMEPWRSCWNGTTSALQPE